MTSAHQAPSDESLGLTVIEVDPSTSAILDQTEQQKQNAANIHPVLMTQSKNNPGSTIPQTLTEIKKVGIDNQQ
jgi:hypothetical protein